MHKCQLSLGEILILQSQKKNVILKTLVANVTATSDNFCSTKTGVQWSEYNAILYIKMNVCLYLIQIHISEPIGTKLCTHLPRGLEETVGYVWAHNISPFPPFRPILSGACAYSCAVDGCRRDITPATALYP